MRRNTPLSVYNRVASAHKLTGSKDMGESYLAYMAAGEAQLIVSLARWAGVDSKEDVVNEA